MRKISKCGVCGNFFPYYKVYRAMVMEGTFSPKRGTAESENDFIFLCSGCVATIYGKERKTKKVTKQLELV